MLYDINKWYFLLGGSDKFFFFCICLFILCFKFLVLLLVLIFIGLNIFWLLFELFLIRFFKDDCCSNWLVDIFVVYFFF